MPSRMSPDEGKSIATVHLEALLAGMEDAFETMQEVLSIPLGMQDMNTQRSFEGWWASATFEQRIEVLKQPEGMRKAMEIMRKKRQTQNEVMP